jgi:benzoyl-CoA reductase/2-hydroxyglutaryl-CoA dehydratase subunit BcrC/BadD/HgdB
MQALADLWSIGTPKAPFVHTVMQPANLGTPAAHPYLVAELRQFQKRMAAVRNRKGGIPASGVPSLNDQDLQASIALHDETRRLVEALSAQRQSFSAREFFGILDAAQIMPRERFNALMSQLLSGLVDAVAGSRRPSETGPGLFLTGAVLDDMRLLELVDDLGARVVGDDLCTGSRHFHGRVGTEAPPLEALADYYLGRPPCPTKHHPTHDPAKHLLEQVDLTRADGIVFILEKFCEPHAFDYARVLPSLDEAGVPHLLLEMEQTPSLEALRTRLQAFVETL